MIFTTFVAPRGDDDQWQSELLEYSWAQSGQPGELVRLVGIRPGQDLPKHALARTEPTLLWTKHPYIDDSYPGYNVPAGLLEWLNREALDATVLLLEIGSVLKAPLATEVGPGSAMAQTWEQLPSGEGPFGLPTVYDPLRAYCVNRELSLPQVQLPLMIHSSDLYTLCPRWLELMGLIRATVDTNAVPPSHPLRVALAIAAAEYDIALSATDFSDQVIAAEDGGRQFIAYTDRFEQERAAGAHLSSLRPKPKPGVRQARVVDQWYLELSSPYGLINLNVSAGAIWSLCDGERSLQDITEALAQQYQLPIDTLSADVSQAAMMLRTMGAINLERVLP
ncbi:MAG: PqqD family protein [Pseudomonadota bacterium]